MASEKAKELAAKQKAELKAEKLRRKNSTDPRDWGQLKQLIETYKMSAEVDKPLPYILIACAVVPVLIGVVVGLAWRGLAIWPFLGLILGMSLGVVVFGRRVKSATFRKYEDQPGSAEVALQMLPKGWTSQPAIAVNRSLDVIHRAIGPGGIVLVGQGDPKRVRTMLANEQRKHETAASGVKVSTFLVGKEQGQIPLNRLAPAIKKLPKVLEPDQIAAVGQRVKALESVKGRVPMPKGPMPNTKGARSALRGR